MRWGRLNQHFKGVVWKRLSGHEVDPKVSNGHEFQGVEALRRLFGQTSRPDVPAKYFLFDDDPDETVVVDSTISWYDARAKQPERSPEWRLYYPKPAGTIQVRMKAGDLMVVCLLQNDSIAVLLTRTGSNSERKIKVLFGIEDGTADPSVKHFSEKDGIDFTAALILEELGLASSELRPEDATNASHMVAAQLVHSHPDALPPGAVVSALVLTETSNVSAVEDPDHALITWIETEEAAFRAWEDARIARRLLVGFRDSEGNADVAAFRDLAMTLRQSRVSRAGSALQNYVAKVLSAHNVTFEPQARTEPGERPDFLFPGSLAYADPSYPKSRLRLLAAKFTVKERWRQVLNEGIRVEHKHLLTVDRSVTESTLKAMGDAKLTLCIPHDYRETYSRESRELILSVRELLDGPLRDHRK